MTVLERLRRKLHDLECRAADADGETLTVLHLEAAEVAAHIEALQTEDEVTA